MTTYRNRALLVAAALMLAGALLVGLDLVPVHAAAHELAPLILAVPGAAAAFKPAESLQALREQRAALVAEMRTMLEKAEGENRDLTEDETKAYDEKKAQLAALDNRIDRLDQLAGDQARLQEVRPAAARRQAIHHPPGPEAAREFSSFGEFMFAVRFRPNDQRLANLYDENVGSGEDMSAANEMRMDQGPTGGFAIPPQWRGDMFRSIEPQDAIVRPRATVIEAGDPPDAPITFPALDQSGTAPQNSFGGVQLAWTAEGGQKQQTDAAVTDITLEPHEIAGHIVITDKLLRNWGAADSLLRKLLRGAAAAAEDYAFLRADGVGKPLGVINASATYKVNRAVASHVGYLDLVNMAARLLMRGGNPIWSAPQQSLPEFATLKDANNNYIWRANDNGNTTNAANGFAGTLLGYPLRWNNRAPALGSLGDIVLADWAYYLIKDGSGPFVAASEHVYFTQNKTVIKIFWNVDGSPWLSAPFQEENGYQVSPFVALDIPAG